MAKLYRNREGKKLYPVCSWEKNQHKLYNALDRIAIREIEEGYTDEIMNERDNIERALFAFDRYVIGDLVYATYEDSCLIKNYVGGYDMRHDMQGHWKRD